MTKAQEQRLEVAAAVGRTWTVSDWQTRFVEHPVLRCFGLQPVWQLVGDTPLTFGMRSDGQAHDGQGQPITLPAEGSIRRLTSAELAASTPLSPNIAAA